MGRHARNLLVCLHVVTSVGWMSQALALFALLVHGMTAGDPRAYGMAEVLDAEVLVHLANASAFTGLMLAPLTRWGYFQYWWVLVKFAITMIQICVAIFLLSPRLTALADGGQADSAALAAGTVLMASAIAFQCWLSVAKPWRRTPWTGTPPKPPAPPGLLVSFIIAVPLLDYLLASRLGHPAPLLTVLTAIAYPIWRRRRLARPGRIQASR
ncbi:hypothetical protein [Streptosporangium sp. NPDC003464]